jgi:hypothetical protein
MCDDQFYYYEECGYDRAYDITWCDTARAAQQCCPAEQRGRAQQAGETKPGRCDVCTGASPASTV